MNRIAILFIIINIVGCSSTTHKSLITDKESASRQYLVGTWYSNDKLANGTTRETKLENFDDGTYRLRVQSTFSSGLVATSMELGQWGLSDNIFFTISRGWIDGCSIVSNAPNDPGAYNAYIIDLLTTSRVSYHHAGSKKTKAYIKAKEGFKLRSGETPILDDCGYISKKTLKKKASA